jgi:hypothetical protein
MYLNEVIFMARKRNTSLLVVLTAAALALSFLVMFVWREAVADDFKHVFYNDTSPSNHENHNSRSVLDPEFNDILETAPLEVRTKPANNPEWFKNDLFNRLYDQTDNSGDPVLLAQLALDARLRAPRSTPDRLLPNEKQSTEMWEATVLGFIDNPKTHIDTADRLQAILKQATVTVRPISGGYTSMGYQKRNGIILDADRAEKLGRAAIPMPILQNTSGVNGWEIVFSFANGEVLSYRIDCGYQPDSTNYGKKKEPTPPPPPPVTTTTPPPSTTTPPPESTTTPPPSTPGIDIDITDTTTTPPATTEPKPPTTTTTPKPKDPNAGPQGQVPNHPDFGGGPNTNNDTRLTDEPKSPSTYTPPPVPVPSADDTRFDTPADQDQGIVNYYQPDSNGNGQTEVIGVDTNGDGQNDSIFTGEVVVGEVPEQSLAKVHADPPPVEPSLNDGSNTGEIGPPQ